MQASRFWKSAALFLAIGLVLYAGLWLVAERRLREEGQRNPFFISQTAQATPDVTLLGASHVMPVGFAGMQELAEQEMGGRLHVLAAEGAGVLPNAAFLEAELQAHAPKNIVYAVDSFVFLSPQWNEERITDSALIGRAPFTLPVFSALWAEPQTRPLALRYLSGFDKVNQFLRFEPDLSEAETTKFDRTHRPSTRVDDQRVSYLFPPTEADVIDGYLAHLARMIESTKVAGSTFTLLLLPAPPRYHERLPETHERVMEKLTALAEKEGVDIVDHSTLLPEDANYYDTDHLNRTGMTLYIEGALGEFLRALKAGQTTAILAKG